MATLRKDGRWTAKARTPQGRVYGYGASAEEAEEDLAEKLKSSPRSRGTTLSSFVAEVWAPSLSQLAPLSEKRYRGVYRKFIQGPMGHLELKSITTLDVNRWLLMIGKEPQGTKTYAFSVLRNIFNAAFRFGLIDLNPCQRIRMPKGAPKRHRVLDVANCQEMLDGCKGSPLYLPVFLASVLGLRRGEICGLKWIDLDRQKRQLQIQRQLQKLSGQGLMERSLKTSSSNRTLILPKFVIDEIDRHGDFESDYICTRNGVTWIPDTLSEFWSLKRAELGLDDWHFHDLRHLAAGLLAAAGCDLLVIAAVLGHRSPDMSQLYTSISESRRYEAADKLGELFSRRP